MESFGIRTPESRPVEVSVTLNYLGHYWLGGGQDVALSQESVVEFRAHPSVRRAVALAQGELEGIVRNEAVLASLKFGPGSHAVDHTSPRSSLWERNTGGYYDWIGDTGLYCLGNGFITGAFRGQIYITNDSAGRLSSYSYSGVIDFSSDDKFEDPFDIRRELPFATPYKVHVRWSENFGDKTYEWPNPYPW